MLDKKKSALWQALGLGPEWVKRDHFPPSEIVVSPLLSSTPDSLPSQDTASIEKALPEASLQNISRGSQKITATQAEKSPIGKKTRGQINIPQSTETFITQNFEGLNRLNWEQICERIRDCKRCRLCNDRTLSVPGLAGHSGEIVLIGEAPGRDEDLQGLPFVGASGKLLDKILTALRWQRGQNVSILNTVKCRPPANRDPRPDEMTACGAYLDRQVEILDPRLLVVMGRSAIERVFGAPSKVSSLRGKVHSVHFGGKSRPAVVTYHPSYLLRAPREKQKAWSDWCLIASALENSADSK